MNRLKPREILAQIGRRDDWYRIVDKGDGAPAEIFLYDEIGYWGTTASEFAEQIADLDTDTIDVHIASMGGEVFDGIAIYNALRTHPATINVQVDSLAASIASVIVQAGDIRNMLTGSQMMIHNASTLVFGDAEELREAADVTEKQDGIISEIYAERSGIAAEKFLELMAAGTWMDAAEAVEAGLADAVVKPSGKAAASDGDNKDAGNDEEIEDRVPSSWDAFVRSTEIGR